jgi:PKD repeat protein
MAIVVRASASVDNGNGKTSGSLTLGAVPNHAAVWLAIARNAPHSTGAIGTVTDNASPPNHYVFQQAIDNGGSAPEIELWIADDVVGAASLVISWTATGGSATSLAAAAFTGQATPSLRALGTGGHGAAPMSDSVAITSVNDLVLLLAGCASGGSNPNWTTLGGSALVTHTIGTTSNSAIAMFQQSYGSTGSQTIEGNSGSPSLAWFAAAVASAVPIVVPVTGSPLRALTAPLTVDFTSSPSGGTGPYTFAWTFGDGGTSTDQNPDYTYVSTGTYSAYVVVTDSLNATGTSAVLEVSIGPFEAFASATPTYGNAPLTVAFTGSSTGGDSPVVSYAWTFGDGGSSSAQNPSHTYAAAGTYAVLLTVTNASGATATAAAVVTVFGPLVTPTYVQSVIGGSPVAVYSLDLPSMNVTKGNTIVVAVQGNVPIQRGEFGWQGMVVTDSLGSVYQVQQLQEMTGYVSDIDIFVVIATAPASGPCVITLTPEVYPTMMSVIAAEVSGVASPVALDTIGLLGIGSSTNVALTNGFTRVPGTLVLSFIGTGGNPTHSSTGAWTLQNQIAVNNAGTLALLTATIAGTGHYTARDTLSSLATSAGIGLAFMPPNSLYHDYVGNQSTAVGYGTAGLTLPPIVLHTHSSLLLVATFEENTNEISSVSGGPPGLVRRGQIGAGTGSTRAVDVWSADDVFAGSYTLKVTPAATSAQMRVFLVEVVPVGGIGVFEAAGPYSALTIRGDEFGSWVFGDLLPAGPENALAFTAVIYDSAGGVLYSGPLTPSIAYYPPGVYQGTGVLDEEPDSLATSGLVFSYNGNGADGATELAALQALVTGADAISIIIDNSLTRLSLTALAVPSVGDAPLPVQFYAVPTGGTPPYTFHWSLGGDGPSSLQNPTHTYLSPGTYFSAVYVTDSLGAQAFANVTVVVSAPVPPTAKRSVGLSSRRTRFYPPP